MAGSGETTKTTPAKNTTFREVFAVRDWRVLWFAQLLSIAGDQFARVAITVLVYDRTRSALLAAVTFALSVVPMFIGGLTLSWLADRYPRRTVMLGCDLASFALVLIMAAPGVPLPVLVALLFAVTLVSAPFMAARSATNREVLGSDRYQLGVAVTQTTYQVGQLAGFAIGGVVTGFAGTSGALLIDAGTFAASALLVRGWVTRRPAADAGARGPGSPQISAGLRIVFRSRVARTTMLLVWLAAFFDVPEGVAAPLGRSLGGGPATVGLILATMTAGAAAGPLLYGRLVNPARRIRLAAALAVATCAVLTGFAVSPPLVPALAILAASGLFSCYFVATNGVFADAIPNEDRGKAFGLVDAGLFLGQGAMIIVGGAAAEAIGAAPVIAICGAAGTAAAVALAGIWRRLIPGLVTEQGAPAPEPALDTVPVVQ